MAVTKNPIVIWCGAAPNQKALAVKLAERFTVAGIVIDEKNQIKTKRKYSKLPFLLWDRFRFRAIYNAWQRLQQFYTDKYPHWPESAILKVPEINCGETEEFTNKLLPDLIVVSGTGLVRERLLALSARVGIVNLHTGLSPYVKGGPNCTNWCIANNDWHLTGNTIMWLNAGIDAGNIIASEPVDVRAAANLFEAQKMVMEQAHELYARAINYLLESPHPYNSVPQQTLGKGRLFLTKMWTAAKKRDLLRNWKTRKSFSNQTTPGTIALPEKSK